MSVFRMPTPVKITGRSSSITNSFVNSIIPVVRPEPSDVVEALSVLGLTPETIACAYCGDRATEWDHLRPLVVGKRPTGYVSEIANLVPACGKCNQSKGNKPWEQWILSTAALSPKARGVANLAERIGRLRAFEQWREPAKVDFVAVVGEELWEEHWRNCDALHALMRRSQETADRVQEAIRTALADQEPAGRAQMSATRKSVVTGPDKARQLGDQAALDVWREFQRWLVGRGYDLKAAGSRVSNLKRVEQFYGALDDHFMRDRCSSLLGALAYSTADKNRSAPNPSLVRINGDLYTGLATLRSAVKLFVEFRTQQSAASSTAPASG